MEPVGAPVGAPEKSRSRLPDEGIAVGTTVGAELGEPVEDAGETEEK